MTESSAKTPAWPGVIRQYHPLLEIAQDAEPVSLLEGNTPLIPVPRLAKVVAPEIDGDFDLRLKYEGLNPTGSFKDRGMTTAITQAVYEGAQAVICASTGNTAASAAAYAARAGLRCIVIVPEGKIAKGKLAGSLAYGADVINITGNFDEGLDLVREVAKKLPITLVNSVNQYRIEGQKSGAFEIVDELGDSPDWMCLPVGNAGNITAYWAGYKQYHEKGIAKSRPRLLGAQAAGSAPIVRGEIVKNPETVATAIRIGNPARWHEAAAALEESDGKITAVTDDFILETWRMIATLEGIFVEPASAAGVAGLRQLIAQGEVDVQGKQVVCIVTGHGLKDPEIVLKSAIETVTLPPTFEALERFLG
ncbi:MAG: threonine synthase [Anaerolineae bacterium]|nr:threonine synthase [Anaerolineae bacterium]